MLKEELLGNVYPQVCPPLITSLLLLHHRYIIIIDVNDDMTTAVTELNQLLEDAEKVSSQQRHSDMEARADSRLVAMESEAAAAPVTNTVKRGIIIECC